MKWPDSLVSGGKVVVVRESKGRQISAACGQLKTEIVSRRQPDHTG